MVALAVLLVAASGLPPRAAAVLAVADTLAMPLLAASVVALSLIHLPEPTRPY